MATSKPTNAQIVGTIVELLTPLESDERTRVIKASLTLLGESMPTGSGKGTNDDAAKDADQDEDSDLRPSPKTKTWQKQNGVTATQLSQVLHHGENGNEVIVGEMPGKNKKEKSLNAYVLTGIAAFIQTGEAKFDDKSARALCTSAGCYDGPNHASTLKDKGNLFTGSKDKGWVLTAPGLKHGATLIKELTSQA